MRVGEELKYSYIILKQTTASTEFTIAIPRILPLFKSKPFLSSYWHLQNYKCSFSERFKLRKISKIVTVESNQWQNSILPIYREQVIISTWNLFKWIPNVKWHWKEYPQGLIWDEFIFVFLMKLTFLFKRRIFEPNQTTIAGCRVRTDIYIYFKRCFPWSGHNYFRRRFNRLSS